MVSKFLVGKIGITLLIITAAMLLTNYNTTYNLERNHNCYIGHVQECLRCHQDNLTYALCSGFCFPPNESDLGNHSLDIYCSIHPSENCWDLPKECNL
jgi:hypothetical protein